jgi:osmotically-inducible protein OsmY
VRPDARILDELCERLARSEVEVGDLEVRVEGGEVHLEGSLATEPELRFVLALAERTLGVRGVHAEVRLREGPEEVEEEDDLRRRTWH